MLLIRRCELVLSAVVFLLLPALGTARQEPPGFSKLFDKTDVMIPARDGIKLHTEIYSPKNATEPLPFVLERTPYGLADDESGYSQILERYAEMIPDGYIFVFQDIRGRFGSEGKFVMQRPVRNPADPKAKPFTFAILFLWAKVDGQWICKGDFFMTGSFRTGTLQSAPVATKK